MEVTIVETVESSSGDALEALMRETLADLALIQLLLDLVQQRPELADLVLPQNGWSRQTSSQDVGHVR
jgi:hypothetical protein